MRGYAWLICGGMGITLAVGPAAAQAPEGMAILKAGQIAVSYQDAGPSLPQGARLAVLEGDPSRHGPFTMRLQFPANYRVPPHTHPIIEHVTILSGAGSIGHGATFNAAGMQALTAGDFLAIQPNTPHFVLTTTAMEIQLHGVGPWAINYVNPQDDPRMQQR